MSFESIDPSIQRDMAGRDLDAARLLGAISKPGELPTLVPETDINKDVKTAVMDARWAAHDLLEDISSDIVIPRVFTFPETDWARLQTGYDALMMYDLKPEIVISPTGRSVETWQRIFTGLRRWQEVYDYSNNPAKLKKEQLIDSVRFGGALYNHGSLSSSASAWNVSLLPGLTAAPIVGLDYFGEGADTRKLDEFLEMHPVFNANARFPGSFYHPQIETYLMLQALRLKSGTSPIDPDESMWTWLDSSSLSALNGPISTDTIAVVGCWHQTDGIVKVTTTNTTIFKAGIRPTISVSPEDT
jgi:hypothetical protein